VAAPKQSALARLFGRAPDYGELYGLLAAAGANARRSTALLAGLLARWPEENGERHDLVDCEHEGDRITHDIIHHLYRKAATPFEQADLLALASGVDDVVDYAEEVADFLFLYKVEAPMEQAVALAGVLAKAGAELADALDHVREVEDLRPHLVEIGRLEDEGDRIERECLAALFEGGIDPMLVIRWKDIVERLEEGVDSCDHVGHVLEGIVVKHA
jgi:uncharacterized protein